MIFLKHYMRNTLEMQYVILTTFPLFKPKKNNNYLYVIDRRFDGVLFYTKFIIGILSL